MFPVPLINPVRVIETEFLSHLLLRFYRWISVLVIPVLLLLTGCAGLPQNTTPAPEPVKPDREKVVITEALQNSFQQALSALDQGEEARAVELLESIIEAQPGLVTPYILQGMIAERQQNIPAAKHWYLEALEKDPANGKALNQLGLIARENGDFSEAEAFYQKAIEADPGESRYYLNYAILLDLYMGKLTQALSQYETYQKMQNQQDEQVALWVVDLKQRIQ